MSTDKVVTLQPTAEHTHTVIFLHGRGSTAVEFQSELFESQASDKRFLPEIFPHIRWVFPTSGILPTKSFGESAMSQWYDMPSTDFPTRGEHEHRNDIDAAVSRITEVIRTENATFGDSRKIILAGISQGCAIGVLTLLRFDFQLGGFVGLSSWLPATVASMPNSYGARRTPIFLSHSVDDGTIDFDYGERLRDKLEGRGFDVEWHRYKGGGHWVNEPQGIDDIVAFMNRIMDGELDDCGAQ